MYKDRSEDTFKNRYPDKWKYIVENSEGQIRTDKGLFSFETFWLLQSVKEQNKNSTDYFWIIVSRVTPEVIHEQSKAERQTLMLAFVILILLLLTLSIVKARSVIAQNIAQAEIQQKNLTLQIK